MRECVCRHWVDYQHARHYVIAVNPKLQCVIMNDTLSFLVKFRIIWTNGWWTIGLRISDIFHFFRWENAFVRIKLPTSMPATTWALINILNLELPLTFISWDVLTYSFGRTLTMRLFTYYKEIITITTILNFWWHHCKPRRVY